MEHFNNTAALLSICIIWLPKKYWKLWTRNKAPFNGVFKKSTRILGTFSLKSILMHQVNWGFFNCVCEREVSGLLNVRELDNTECQQN